MSAVTLLKAVQGEAVDRGEAADLLRAFAADTSSPEMLAAFLTALHIRGEKAPVLLGFVDVLREHMVPVNLGRIPAMDLCGTGGDGQNTVNLSTAAAFVTAAAGVPVAKHGNHGVSSRTGSVDVLQALGVPHLLQPAQVAPMVHHLGLGFMYAPHHHPLFGKIGPVRRQLGFRTAFNLLGPLCNPAQVKRQVIGVPSQAALQVIADVLAALGVERTMVVHTPGPYDEVSLTAPALCLLVEHGTITAQVLEPSAFGAQTIDAGDLKGSDAAGNAKAILEVFEGKAGGLRDAICANAACALFVASRVKDVREGFHLAQDTIASGLALEKLQALRTSQIKEDHHDLAI